MHSIVDGHLGDSSFGAMMNKAARDVLIHVLWSAQHTLLPGTYLGLGLLGTEFTYSINIVLCIFYYHKKRKRKKLTGTL